MHCTGQTSTQARSFTSMHASVMIARPAMMASSAPQWAEDAARVSSSSYLRAF
jgi:hypothetical protein